MLNLLIVLCEHNDHLTISSILMNNKTAQMNFGLALQSLPVLQHNFTEKSAAEADPYLDSNQAFEAAAGVSEEGN